MGNRLAYSSPDVNVSSPALPELQGQPTLVFSRLSGTDHLNALFEYQLQLRTADERSPILGTAANLDKKPLRGTASAAFHMVGWQPLACWPAVSSETESKESAEILDPDAMQAGGVSGLNYTPYYIHSFGITGDHGITGGGPNIFPATPDNMPSGGGGEMYCASFPAKWRPGLKVNVRWLVEKIPDGVTYGSWYRAAARHRPSQAGRHGLPARLLAAVLLAGLGLLAGCDDRAGAESRESVESIDPDAMQAGGVRGLNYTPYYIHSFGITGDHGITGGGPNIFPATPDQMPSGGHGEMCCASFPAKWRPGLKVNVRWLVDKKQDGVTYGSWYQAKAEIAEYGPRAGALFVVFLPEDRIKVMVQDGNANGHNDLTVRPADDDPYVVAGTLDEAANREAEARREVQRQRKEAYAVEVANREKKLLRQQENER
ncbi:DUF3304 domain-containing protein [Cupriavidus sp. USMAA2-4]|uniref:DUF3304 domain-containing protein n=1 Tax=Cupriavidus sp. USMAA2-4 TaxID=876364 RepID=UPI000A9DFB4C